MHYDFSDWRPDVNGFDTVFESRGLKCHYRLRSCQICAVTQRHGPRAGLGTDMPSGERPAGSRSAIEGSLFVQDVDAVTLQVGHYVRWSQDALEGRGNEEGTRKDCNLDE